MRVDEPLSGGEPVIQAEPPRQPALPAPLPLESPAPRGDRGELQSLGLRIATLVAELAEAERVFEVSDSPPDGYLGAVRFRQQQARDELRAAWAELDILLGSESGEGIADLPTFPRLPGVAVHQGPSEALRQAIVSWNAATAESAAAEPLLEVVETGGAESADPAEPGPPRAPWAEALRDAPAIRPIPLERGGEAGRGSRRRRRAAVALATLLLLAGVATLAVVAQPWAAAGRGVEQPSVNPPALPTQGLILPAVEPTPRLTSSEPTTVAILARSADQPDDALPTSDDEAAARDDSRIMPSASDGSEGDEVETLAADPDAGLPTDAPAEVGRALVRIPGFRSVQLRQAPSTSARALMAIPNGIEVVVLDGTATADRFRWSLVRAPDGQVGWIVSTALQRVS